jgi:phosphocarrier protein HPr
MIEKAFDIKNSSGLHARPAALLVRITGKYKSEVFIEKDGYKVNGKSIMGVMTLAAESGSTIIVTAEGEDEQEVMNAVEELIESKFNEE